MGPLWSPFRFVCAGWVVTKPPPRTELPPLQQRKARRNFMAEFAATALRERGALGAVIWRAAWAWKDADDAGALAGTEESAGRRAGAGFRGTFGLSGPGLPGA